MSGLVAVRDQPGAVLLHRTASGGPKEVTPQLRIRTAELCRHVPSLHLLSVRDLGCGLGSAVASL